MKQRCSDLAIGFQREKYLKSNSAQSVAFGHYRENNNEQIASTLISKSGWIGKERLTAQYKVGVHSDKTRTAIY